MAYIAITGCAALIAWCIALIMIHFPRTAVLFHSLIVGGLCAIAESVLFFLNIQHLSIPIQILIFLLMTLAVSLERTCETHGDAILAFLVAQGAFSVLLFPKLYFDFGWLIALFLMTIFVWCLKKTHGGFPEKGWRDYFSGQMPKDKRISVEISHVYGILIFTCMICSMGCILGEVYLYSNEIKRDDLQVFYGFFVGLLCVIFWGGIYCVSLIVEYRRETLAALIEQQYRTEMQSFMNIIRSQRHDYNFHVQTLARMIKTGNVSACEKYIDELVKDSIAMNTVLPVKDPAISALINNFCVLAAREGIELHINIQNDLSRVVTTVYETNKVISNLLQNAIDEVKSHRDKSYGIHLTILKRGEYCVIHVSNAFNNQLVSGDYLKNIYSHGYTTKAGHDGVGLSSVRSLLERYKGVIYTQVEDNYIRFTAKIPLCYTANKEDQMVREGQI